jgi:hypothetical protein
MFVDESFIKGLPIFGFFEANHQEAPRDPSCLARSRLDIIGEDMHGLMCPRI